MLTVTTFGEIMGRLNPPGFQRLRQCLPGTLHWTFAGAEANVAVSLALLGGQARYVTALPRNPLGDACVSHLRGLGVDTSHVVRKDAGRLGLYFVEAGANQRPSQVVYDRDGSTISLTEAHEYRWEEALADSGWLHLSGITPSISAAAAASTLAAAQTAKAMGLTVSCDLNFRAKMWRWEPGTSAKALAERTMRSLLPFVDILIANEADCSDVLQIRAAETNVEAGQLSVDHYPEVAARVTEQFPNLSHVAITLRESHSASHNDWGGMLFARGTQHAPLTNGRYQPYPIRNMVDRVGAGDAFAAGLIFALNTTELAAPADAISFAVAASCLAHSIEGDFNYSSRAEVAAPWAARPPDAWSVELTRDSTQQFAGQAILPHDAT